MRPKGFHHSPETIAKIKTSNEGIKRSADTIIKIKEARKNQIIIHSEGTKQKIAQAHIGMKANKNAKRKMSLAKKDRNTWNKGLTIIDNPNLARPMTQEHSDKIAKSVSEAWQDPLKRKNMQFNGLKHFKGGYRQDLGHYVRSAFEANYCRFLNWFSIKYEFESEKCLFKLDDGTSYTCDFYLPDIEQYIELKGYIREDAQNKINIFQIQCPNIKWYMIMQDSEEWKYIVINYSKLIPNWEYNKKEKTWINKDNNLKLIGA